MSVSKELLWVLSYQMIEVIPLRIGKILKSLPFLSSKVKKHLWRLLFLVFYWEWEPAKSLVAALTT